MQQRIDVSENVGVWGPVSEQLSLDTEKCVLLGYAVHPVNSLSDVVCEVPT